MSFQCVEIKTYHFKIKRIMTSSKVSGSVLFVPSGRNEKYVGRNRVQTDGLVLLELFRDRANCNSPMHRARNQVNKMF